MLDTNGIYFTDETGRVVMLRGVNLSGAAKLPFTPNIPSHQKEHFFESERNVSFVGRPFPLDEADQHFERLKHWGFNFFRFNITWEAIEHEGPGIYDMEYLDYLVEVLKKAKEYGFRCFIDPHQDVWSRFSGGSGAPSWTFKIAGLNIRNFKESGAALVHNLHDDPENFPRMIWPTNYNKLACSTMFTLFFGGKVFAPKCEVENKDGIKVNIQDFLQQHFVDAIAMVAKAVKKEGGLEDSVVLGYDTLNEPHHGFIGVQSIKYVSELQELKNGSTPSPFQTMLLGAGFATYVDAWNFGWAGPQKGKSYLIDPRGTSAWIRESPIIEGEFKVYHEENCLWASHGVWDIATQELLKPDYFYKNPFSGKKYDFLHDFFMPFIRKYTISIRNIHQNAIIFVEPPVNEHPPTWDVTAGDSDKRIVYSPHWYDGLTLVNKSFNTWFNVDFLNAKRGKYLHYATAVKFGISGINTAFRNQLELIKSEGISHIGEFPCWGDGWNGEDLSIFCKDEQRMSYSVSNKSTVAVSDHEELPRSSMETADTIQLVDSPIHSNFIANIENEVVTLRTNEICPKLELSSSLNSDDNNTISKVSPDDRINSGGRVLAAIVRPYPIYIPGRPLSLHFKMSEAYLYFSYEHDFISNCSTEASFVTDEPHSLKFNVGKGKIGNHDQNAGEWLEFFLPRQYFSNEEEIDTFVAHGDTSLLTAPHEEGEWIFNCKQQRAYYRCSCYGNKNKVEENTSTNFTSRLTTSVISPAIMHSIIIRKRSKDELKALEISRNLIKSRRKRRRGFCPDACTLQ
ncbi:hypothetical protein HK099_008562 [Clydaea vesicula]|uniref:Glycoside hydrolase family 5 domain-containing protein n=1 Tax=Clydaea vesicula TaxID=447962 RepID=A0AAD5XVS9_9FUNG|nr:hypothetical protein HK099_008562 [Clydaea vesicula]